MEDFDKIEVENNYVGVLLDNNDITKLLPVTHKNNHGVSLDIWEVQLKARDIPYLREGYKHQVFSREGHSEFDSEHLILTEV